MLGAAAIVAQLTPTLWSASRYRGHSDCLASIDSGWHCAAAMDDQNAGVPARLVHPLPLGPTVVLAVASATRMERGARGCGRRSRTRRANRVSLHIAARLRTGRVRSNGKSDTSHQSAAVSNGGCSIGAVVHPREVAMRRFTEAEMAEVWERR